jgi:hypothetical protein
VVFFSAAHNGRLFLRVARLFGEDSSLAAENSCHVLNRLFTREKDFSAGDYSRCLTISRARQMKHWETIADNLSKGGWSWGCVAAIDSNGRTIFIADAHRDDGKRFVVRADEKLTALVELVESAVRGQSNLDLSMWAGHGFSSGKKGTLKCFPGSNT